MVMAINLQRILQHPLGQKSIQLLWHKILPNISPGAISSMAKLVFTPSWKKFSDYTNDPEKVQQQILFKIVRENRDTQFGREHRFAAINSWESYCQWVPIRDYSQFEPFLDSMVNGTNKVLTSEPVTFFARSSGTTGKPKYIPITKSYLEEYRVGRKVWMRQVALQFPQLVRGSLLTIHSPQIDGHTRGGVPYGSITVAMGASQQGMEGFEEFQQIPMEVFYLKDFNSKYYLLLRMALEMKISILAAVNPSTILLLCQKLDEFAPDLIEDLEKGTINASFWSDEKLCKRLEDKLEPNIMMAQRLRHSLEQWGMVKPTALWPQLCGILSWKGGSAPFYLEQFKQYLDVLPVMDYGFLATEGSFSIPLSAASDDGVLAIGGHFFEFLPENQQNTEGAKTLLAHQLKEGEKYYIIVTASNGMYRYNINDIVQVTGFYQRTPLVRFLHKGGNIISITGEKVTERQVVMAVEKSLKQSPLPPANGFTVTLRSKEGELPRYQLAIEFIGDENEILSPSLRKTLNDFLLSFDNNLKEFNIEYSSKRGSLRLEAPILQVLAFGSYQQFRIKKVAAGAPDSHLKPPHLLRNAHEIDFMKVVLEIGG